MSYEDNKKKLGGGPNFGLVVLMAATAILGILIAAALIVTWRGKEAKKVPFTKHPVSLVVPPPARWRLG